MNITFIGLGIMGSRMARQLLDQGVNLTVYNRSQEAMEALVAAGARKARSFEHAVIDADIVFSMLSTPDVVEEIFLSKNGLLDQMEEEALWVDCSTVNPSFSVHAAQIAKAKDIRFLDAPVAGSAPQAEAKTLIFMVGGQEQDLSTAHPYFEMMGQRIMHLGPNGKGASFKMLINAMLAQSMTIFSETVLLGRKMGFDEAFLLENLPKSPVSAPFTKSKAEKILQQDDSVDFPLEWMHKDLHLATQTAYEVGQPLHLASTVEALYASAKSQGLARKDFSAIYNFLNADQ